MQASKFKVKSYWMTTRDYLPDVFFVNRRTIPWPPEPLRNLTIKAILGYMHWEDRIYDPPKRSFHKI